MFEFKASYLGPIYLYPTSLLFLAYFAHSTCGISSSPPQPQNPAHTEVIIGIYLGTGHVGVGVFRNNSIEIISNDRGENLTPNMISFANQRVLIGEDARDALLDGPLMRYAVLEIDRIIGKRWVDNGVRHAIRSWDFAIVEVDGEPKTDIENWGGEKTLYSLE